MVSDAPTNTCSSAHPSTELKEPSFLRKLKREHGGDSDRHDRPQARPKRLKKTDDDDDDGPTYVDEESHDTISKAEFEAMAGDAARTENEKTSTETPGAPETSEPSDKGGSGPNLTQTLAPKENVVDVGARKKRKVVKAVGESQAVDEPDATPTEESKLDERPRKPMAPKGKKKKMKLSFDN